METAATGHSVGPMWLIEHAAWFVFLSLIVFLVYHGLREDSVAQAVARGIKKWVAFVISTAILAGLFSLFSHML